MSLPVPAARQCGPSPPPPPSPPSTFLSAMAGRLADSHSVQLLPALGLGLVISTLLVPLRVLVGLRCYYAAAGASTEVKARSRSVRARRGSTVSKRDDDVDLGGAEALIVAKLSIQQATQLLYRDALENLVRGVACMPTPPARPSRLRASHPAGGEALGPSSCWIAPCSLKFSNLLPLHPAPLRSWWPSLRPAPQRWDWRRSASWAGHPRPGPSSWPAASSSPPSPCWPK